MIKIDSFDAVVFDLDGTLVPTESIYLQSWRIAADDLNLVLPDELFMSLVGRNREDTPAELSSSWKSRRVASQFLLASQRIFEQRLNTESLNPCRGVLDTINLFQEYEKRLAIATSSDLRTASMVLQAASLSRYFKKVYSGDTVRRGKPHPEIYLKAFSGIGVPPDRCLVFEDSVNGAKAALTAGARVVHVPELAGMAFECPGVLRVESFTDLLWDDGRELHESGRGK